MIGPDFLCIGMVKGGTTWLFDQLRAHPDVWMPPIKEIHYFNAARNLEFPRRNFLTMAMRARAKNTDPAARAFFDAIRACEGFGVEPSLYGNLFAPKGERISGDVSPGYTALDGKTVRTIAHAFPSLKVVMIARDPVDRAWSHISMRWRQGGFPPCYLWCEPALRAYLDDRDMQVTGFASRAVSTWAEHFGADRFRVFNFDDTARDPAAQRARILSFIGIDPARGALAPNVKEGRQKLTLTAEILQWLEAYFADERERWERLRTIDLRDWCVQFSAETREI